MRDNRFDNLKAFLMLTVVLCHLFELFPGTLKYRIYIFIYAFHMPLFIFISGYFARFDIKNIVCKLLYPYVVFQVIYCAFTQNRIQRITPHWILWYLLCLAMWTLSLSVAGKKPYIALIISIVLSLLSVYSDKIGKPLALGRFFAFYPFFMLGFVAKKEGWLNRSIRHSKAFGAPLLVLAFWLTSAVLPYIKTSWFYHSESFFVTGETLLWRAILFGIALLWCGGFLLVAPKKRIPVLTDCGKYSICIFLLHGLVVYAFRLYFSPFILSEMQNLVLAVFIAIMLCLAFGNKYVHKVLSPLLVFPLQNAKKVV